MNCRFINNNNRKECERLSITKIYPNGKAKTIGIIDQINHPCIIRRNCICFKSLSYMFSELTESKFHIIK